MAYFSSLFLATIMKRTSAMNRLPRVLFVDQCNAARSRMAEALLRHFGEGRYDVYSAGVESGAIPVEAADVLRETGVPVPSTHGATIDEVRHLAFDYVITVCDEDEKDC